mmetsp:Transcript_6793/g.14817  ORF Transcript_6793/g.14817 Transcript_6793/m.14817 type:complete len:80 (-) Transcript_6793:2304-2543(-)
MWIITYNRFFMMNENIVTNRYRYIKNNYSNQSLAVTLLWQFQLTHLHLLLPSNIRLSKAPALIEPIHPALQQHRLHLHI